MKRQVVSSSEWLVGLWEVDSGWKELIGMFSYINKNNIAKI